MSPSGMKGVCAVSGPVSDDDSAYYFGAIMSLIVIKEVWDGDSWEDANTTTGPYLLEGTGFVKFRITVTNTGNVMLSNIGIVDTTGLLGAGTSSLDPSESVWLTYLADWGPGQQVNIANATGWFGERNCSDEDPAYYFGAVPGISIVKEVYDGSVWRDANDEASAPFLLSATMFRVNVTNTGNVPLTGIIISDAEYAGTFTPFDLEVGEWNVTEYAMVWAPGLQMNTASATGNFGSATITDDDVAYYFGADPSIDVEKLVWNGSAWVDADTATGPYLLTGVVQFKVVVINTGNVELNNILVVDDKYGNIVIGTLIAGGSAEVTYDMAWAIGQQNNTATVTGYFLEQFPCTDIDEAYYFGADPCICITKEVSFETSVFESHTQGYWKNHPGAWVGIDADDMFPWVCSCRYPSGLTYMEVLNKAVKGDASTSLAHQYIAAKINDLKWGAPAAYAVYIEAAEEFLADHPVGSYPDGDDYDYAIELVEILTAYNEQGDCAVFVGGVLTYTVNVTNCGNIPLYNVKVVDSLLNQWFYLAGNDTDGILSVGEWWTITYTYDIEGTTVEDDEDPCGGGCGGWNWGWNWGGCGGWNLGGCGYDEGNDGCGGVSLCCNDGDDGCGGGCGGWGWNWWCWGGWSWHCGGGCDDGDQTVTISITNIATAYGQWDLENPDAWVSDSAAVDFTFEQPTEDDDDPCGGGCGWDWGGCGGWDWNWGGCGDHDDGCGGWSCGDHGSSWCSYHYEGFNACRWWGMLNDGMIGACNVQRSCFGSPENVREEDSTEERTQSDDE